MLIYLPRTSYQSLVAFKCMDDAREEYEEYGGQFFMALDIKFYMDGNKICCVGNDFVNLMESPAGFGNSYQEAFENLIKERSKVQ